MSADPELWGTWELGYLEDKPENGGLTIVTSIDDPEACYSFDSIILLRHEDGRLFWAADAGCSCPMPFEDYRRMSDLDALHHGSWPEFERMVSDWCSYNSGTRTHELRIHMLRTAQAALAGAA